MVVVVVVVVVVAVAIVEAGEIWLVVVVNLAAFLVFVEH